MDKEKTVTVDVLIRLEVTLKSGVLIDKVIQQMDYDFVDLTGKAVFEDSELRSFEVVKPLGVSSQE